ncbi:MAG: hypothetical protein OES10_14160 [Gammaproteobacteria bacterium]|nr:hypothetical protein [Gammaproteobacteria bacterium]
MRKTMMNRAFFCVVTLLFGVSTVTNVSHAIDLDNAYVEAAYPLDYGGEGATSDGSTLWIMQQTNVTLHSYDISGGGFSPITSLPTLGGFGLAWDGTGIWVSGGGDIYLKYDPTTGNVVNSFVSSTPTFSLGDLTFDGQYLWKASRPEFNQIDPATGNVISTISGFDLPGIEEGLTYDGQYLYAISYTDGSDPRIWKIDPTTGALLTDSFALPVGTYNGLAFDGQGLWAVGFSSRTLYKISSTAVTEITIDIKPGSDPNAINADAGGFLPVAILTDTDFDALRVDYTTVAFGPSGEAPAREAKAKDVDGDGDSDLILHFKISDTGIACGDIAATLTGATFDGEPITGTDAITTVKCPPVTITTITELVGDKDCFGVGGVCSDGDSLSDLGVPGGDNRDPGDPLGTDWLGTSVGMGQEPSFDFQFDIASFDLIGVTPTSASLTMFTAGIELVGATFFFNSVNIGFYTEPDGFENIAATVIFDVPISLLSNQNNLTLSIPDLGLVQDGYTIDYVELTVVGSGAAAVP